MAAMGYLLVALMLGYHLPAVAPLPTTETITPPACKADEEWRDNDCYCKPQYSVTKLADMKPQLTCGVFTMRATFMKCQMKMLQAYFNQSSIKDGECFTYQDIDAKNTLSVIADLKNNTCGVQSSEANSILTYRVTLNITVQNGIITRNDRLIVRLQCDYKMDMITSLHKILNATYSSVHIDIEGKGEFDAYMALYNDSTYLSPHQGSSLTLSKEDTLYIGTFIIGGDESEHVLVMTNCYATPTDHRDDPVKYYIIQDRCPNKDDKTIKVEENGKSRMGRVSVQFFTFVDYDRVYLHCALSLCNTKGNCEPVCPARTVRAQDDIPITGLRIGPISRSDIPESTTTIKAATTKSLGVIGAQTSWILISSILFFLAQSYY